MSVLGENGTDEKIAIIPLEEKIGEAKKILVSNISILFERNENIEVMEQKIPTLNENVFNLIILLK